MQHQNKLSAEDSAELSVSFKIVSVQTQCNSCWKDPQEVSCPSSSSKQGQLRDQRGMFQVFSSPILKPSEVRYQAASLGYLPHCPASSRGESLFLYPAWTSPIISCPPTTYYHERPSSISLIPWAQGGPPIWCHLPTWWESTRAATPCHR